MQFLNCKIKRFFPAQSVCCHQQLEGLNGLWIHGKPFLILRVQFPAGQTRFICCSKIYDWGPCQRYRWHSHPPSPTHTHTLSYDEDVRRRIVLGAWLCCQLQTEAPVTNLTCSSLCYLSQTAPIIHPMAVVAKKCVWYLITHIPPLDSKSKWDKRHIYLRELTQRRSLAFNQVGNWFVSLGGLWRGALMSQNAQS